ncbi:hypothetical protein tinsulaeT_35240 [Thalassotalea insulae]|uniref:GyrI-like small molecule binding domain-containing protein n=1 Tax=Thalassotalea insulae TaxID=2056778 RepID=A0ABQ6GY97_9GAMM|nr:GyrI-like domain-containing protein [Thalassotalea insulae]GLX80184.1 hypothetical protein tinsulaeT_35240 [Thalassotalea insulae]
MSAKYEWRKQEKAIYLPKNKPEIINVPAMNFITLAGEGNPNSEQFTQHIATLYAVAYAIKMTLKKAENTPANYQDFTVYPLEGIWDINEQAKQQFNGTISKDDLVYQLMIRQPHFVSEQYFQQMREQVVEKKANPLLKQVKFETITDGKSIQMLHLGKFEDEPLSFEQMEAFADAEELVRLSKTHREIYLSAPRKVAPEKPKTVLRFSVE